MDGSMTPGTALAKGFLGAVSAFALSALPAATRAPGCGEPKETDFVRVPVATLLNEPMEVEFTPDGKAFIIEKVTGKVLLHDPATNALTLAGQLEVSTAGNHADGLLGLELDPGFRTNRWLYLYHSPKDKAVNRISRFTVTEDRLDMNSVKVIFEVPTHRNHCCHSAGGLESGPGGNLYVSTGDNANVTSNVVNTQAEGTSANTNDLRGKILRIRPEPDGGYSIPDGNLFPPGTEKTRPEIYSMGHRNPFRFSVDPRTGWILSGDVGPDGRETDYDEFNVLRSAGNQGWPYFVGNTAYLVDGKPAVADAPVNNSPLNTGLKTLPPARNPSLWYAYAGPTQGGPLSFTGFDFGGRVACGGPVYYYDPANPSKVKLPPWFDGKWFIYDFMQRWIKAVSLDGRGNFVAVKDMFPTLRSNQTQARGSSLKIGPDGALYQLEYGWVRYAASTAGGLYRFEYKPPRPDCLPAAIREEKRIRRGAGPHDLRVFGVGTRTVDAAGRSLQNSP